MTAGPKPREASVAPVLTVSTLRVTYAGASAPALDGVDLAVSPGETVGLLGASGSGKTTLAHAVFGVLPPPTAVEGVVSVDGHDLAMLPAARLRHMRRSTMGLVMQASANAWNPVQPLETEFRAALGATRRDADRSVSARFASVLAAVDLPATVLSRYPHELSGGMRQRAALALTLLNTPQLLIADEPTSGVDVITQQRLLQLISQLQQTHAIAVVLIAHDLAAIAPHCDRLVVLDGGRVIAAGPTDDILANADSAAKAADARVDARVTALVAAARQTRPRTVTTTPQHDVHAPLLETREVAHTFAAKRGLRNGRRQTLAVDGVSLTIRPGARIGLVGESGCGKSTLARLLVRLLDPTDGALAIADTASGSSTGARMIAAEQVAPRAWRRRVQMVMQDPYGALDPRQRVVDALTEPLRVHGRGTAASRRAAATDVLTSVGLDPALFFDRYPYELSGGQRQRVAIARALIVEPEVLIADEPTSMLDGPARGAIVELLGKLADEHGLALVYITHDLAVAHQLCTEIAVMYGGAIVEHGPTDQLVAAPQHPYTHALRAAIPRLDVAPGALPIIGEPRQITAPVAACRFLDRCVRADAICTAQPDPSLRPIAERHHVACYLPGAPEGNRGELGESD